MMQKIVVMPDSFKGTVPSTDFCAMAADLISRYLPGCSVVSIPVADGGEGSVDCFLTALGGQRIEVPVQGPLFEPITSFFGL